MGMISHEDRLRRELRDNMREQKMELRSSELIQALVRLDCIIIRKQKLLDIKEGRLPAKEKKQ
jgi:hypothetical protein